MLLAVRQGTGVNGPACRIQRAQQLTRAADNTLLSVGERCDQPPGIGTTGGSAHITGMYTLSELGAPCNGDATVVLVELLLTHARLGCLGAASAPSQAINRVVADQAATHDAPRALISLPHRVPSEACD